MIEVILGWMVVIAGVTLPMKVIVIDVGDLGMLLLDVLQLCHSV